MALNQQEKQILERGKELGKSRTETLRAISNYRSQQSQAETERGNVGTGFTPTRELTGEENIGEFAETTVRNIPRSASEFGKNVLSAVTNPIETGKSLFNLVQGAAGKGAQALAENTGVGQRLLQTAQESRERRGVEALPTDEQGNIQTPDTEDMQAVSQVSNFLEERYGGIDNIKETVAEDPVGFLADIAGIISGAGAGARAAGLTGAGRRLSQAGQVLEPTNIAARGAGAVSRSVGSGARATGRVAQEIAGDFLPGQRRSVIKALDLTSNDIRKIEGKTGNQIDQFILENNISGTNVDDIAEGLSDLRNERYLQVREAIRGVDKTYDAGEVPRVRQALTSLDELYKDTPGLEDLNSEISSLLGKEQYSLTDVQRTKELIDDADNIFKQSGETKAGSQSRGFANIRSDIKNFIEDEVPDESIRQLNNDVQTAKEIEKSILKRSTRDLTRKQIGLTDWAAGGAFGTSAAVGAISPAAAIGLFVTKKALENPAFKIALARNIKRISESKAAEIFDTITKGNALSGENRQIMQNALEGARRESGLTIPVLETVEETTGSEQE